MPNYRRLKVAGGTYFFTVATELRRPLLLLDNVRAALRAGIQQARTTLPFTIEAWVLLPDHLHCMWTLPVADGNYAARWAIIKRQVSRIFCQQLVDASPSRSKRQESGLWQRRFWEHQIRDDTDFERHADYIHWNPVKHGYVERPSEWAFSTFRQFAAQGIYPPNWCVAGDDQDAAEFGE